MLTHCLSFLSCKTQKTRFFWFFDFFLFFQFFVSPIFVHILARLRNESSLSMFIHIVFGLGLASVADSMQFCGLNTIVSNWTKVAHQIGSNPGRGVTNLMNAMAQRIQGLNMPNLIQQINQDLDNGMQYAAGVKIGTIIATILTPNVPDTNYLRFLETLSRLVFLIKH
jgi:hypothetical protein